MLCACRTTAEKALVPVFVDAKRANAMCVVAPTAGKTADGGLVDIHFVCQTVMRVLLFVIIAALCAVALAGTNAEGQKYLAEVRFSG